MAAIVGHLGRISTTLFQTILLRAFCPRLHGEDHLVTELVVLGKEFKIAFYPQELRTFLAQTSELYRIAAAKMFEKHKV